MLSTAPVEIHLITRLNLQYSKRKISEYWYAWVSSMLYESAASLEDFCTITTDPGEKFSEQQNFSR
jgi:hypothetical protein